MPIIKVDHVTKEYRLGAMQSLKSIVRRMVGAGVDETNNFKALDDVHFSIDQGEVVGIIGHNGAGKSTLLKLLSNISTPTAGKIRIDGRVAPLIEVGAGFVGDMTGRENIYLNASILGMSREDTSRKIDEIVQFSELEKFIDTPVKRYSSGMQVRLAFSVATTVNASIIVIDEVLAVGDIAFQRKCFERMQKMLNDRSKTVLIVGHNIRQIQRIATRMILLNHGRIVIDGDPEKVTAVFYNEMDQIVDASRATLAGGIIHTTGEILIDAVFLIDDENQRTDRVEMCANSTVRLCFTVKTGVQDIEIAVGINTTDQIFIATESSGRENLMSFEPGNYTLDVKFIGLPLLPGEYAFRVFFQDGLGTNLVSGEDVSRFRVSAGNRNRANLSNGSLIHLPTEWLVKRVS